MRASILLSGFITVVIGFGGSLAIILAAIRVLDATPEQTSSWVAMMCLCMAVTTAWFCLRHRTPILSAWSTPGAALIAATSGISINAAIGAFMLAALLILLTAAFRPVARLVEGIPGAIASAMLAGILFEFVLAPLVRLPEAPALVLPLLAAFIAVRLISPIWAVVAVLVLGIALVALLGMAGPLEGLAFSKLVWIEPSFDPAVLIGLGIPLYLVTMASQILPGFAVLRAAGYPVPAREILGVTGLVSLLTAGFGAHTTNMAAITASICASPDAHPDKAKRWQAGMVAAAIYLGLFFIAGSLATMLAQLPPAFIATVAGVALAGPFMGALAAGLADEQHRFAATVTFVVTASGLGFAGIGAAFWGLLAGLAVFWLEGLKSPRTAPQAVPSK